MVCVCVCVGVMAAFEVIASSQEECNAWIADIRAQMSTKRVGNSGKSRVSLTPSKKRELGFWHQRGKHIVWKTWVTPPGMTLENKIICECELLTQAQSPSPRYAKCDDHDEDGYVSSSSSFDDGSVIDTMNVNRFSRKLRESTSAPILDEDYEYLAKKDVKAALERQSRIIKFALDCKSHIYIFYIIGYSYCCRLIV